MDKNNTAVAVWFDVLVSALDVGPDVRLPDILLCFEIQHLFDTTWNWGLGGVHGGTFVSIYDLQLPRHPLASSSYMFMRIFAEPFPQPQSPCIFHLWSFSFAWASNTSPPHPITVLQAAHTPINPHRPHPSLSTLPCSSLLPPHFEVPFSNLLEEDQTGCKTESLIN